MTYDDHVTAHMSVDERREYDKWLAARGSVIAFFERLGRTIGYFNDTDVLVVDDMMASDWIEVEITDYSLLDPVVIDSFRTLLAELPRMLVTIRVAYPGSYRKDWPGMGLSLLDGKISDGLKREYLPAPYNTVRYTNSRPDDRPDLPFT